ncbi:MAG: hypothetical protein NWP69_11105 [Congregibacter sp.]|nr:hypothetical protein [Congregibacter sp.]
MTVINKYLSRYGEPEARVFLNRPLSHSWDQVLVVPAYGESPACIDNLLGFTNTLLILVLNHPDTDPDSTRNHALREHLCRYPADQLIEDANASLRQLGDGNHVLVIERPRGLPRKQGVGLARKIGCDASLALRAHGCIKSDWIHCTDADASLPRDYFSAADAHSNAAALTYRFEHETPTDSRQSSAIALYQSYLQSYVDGLSFAGSAYAFHTIGSCIAVNAEAYARVRGFPRLAAGEDFYLLNKIAKQGIVATPNSKPVLLSARLSQRAPFGTGPALIKILEHDNINELRLFYHPRCFDSLAAVLGYVKECASHKTTLTDVEAGLADSPNAFAIIAGLGLGEFLAHAQRQCSSQIVFTKQFHQWFDGFKTLKFIHGAAQFWPKVTANELLQTKKKPHP